MSPAPRQKPLTGQVCSDVDTLRAVLAREQRRCTEMQRRAELAEASARHAWRIAAWGGARREGISAKECGRESKMTDPARPVGRKPPSAREQDLPSQRKTSVRQSLAEGHSPSGRFC